MRWSFFAVAYYRLHALDIQPLLCKKLPASRGSRHVSNHPYPEPYGIVVNMVP